MSDKNQFDDVFSDDILSYIKGDSETNPFEKQSNPPASENKEDQEQPAQDSDLFPTINDKVDTKPIASDSKDHRHGHRQRLRERFLKGGADAIANYELLELILFLAIPRKDVKPLAKELLSKFGTLNDVLCATVDQLTQVKGISETTATHFKVIQTATHRILSEQIQNKNIISSWQSLLDYLQTVMGPLKKEQFRILFLDKKNALIADEIQQEGTIDHTPVYPREVMKRALELHATALILVHNHPSGDPKPSKADIDMTKAIVDAGKNLGIVIHDHLVIARSEYVSFKSLGLL
ncbi:MAG: hypothetical protein CMP22_02330 [Rickettsiales bacterium]|nr:hypothetical protein [Rickettsiales bacterium]|tara:strand:+ start:224 stop:1102 length:879 start_codon:yes stop_codon:yes gene_type:complete